MRVHIIGAGLAGLAAAVRLSSAGLAVSLYESAPRAGGRCRSFHDAHLGCVIDNGNHLLMSGNHAAMSYLESIGARGRLAGPQDADFPFYDVATGARWHLRPSRGVIPWWILDAKRRVPNTKASSYLSAVNLLKASADATVTDCIAPESCLYRNFWEPLTVAALNAAPDQAAARLMRPVLLETFLKGADACRPLVARDNLADTLVDPALALLEARGVDIRFGCRVRALTMADDMVSAIATEDSVIPVRETDVVISAVPSWIAETLIPGLTVPPPGDAIVNVHYRLPATAGIAGQVNISGLVGGIAQWIFVRGDLASVTISAAGALAEEDADSIAAQCWSNVAEALNLGALPQPPARVIKEKRATFAQTPSGLAARPSTTTHVQNLLLAGDWTATGLPATIEGAVRSGFKAADITLQRRSTAVQTEAA